MMVFGKRAWAVLIALSFVILGSGTISSEPSRSGVSDWTPVMPDDFETEYPQRVTIVGGAVGGTGYVVDLIWNQTAGPPALNMTEDGMKLNFTPSGPGDYTFEMRVLDNSGNESDTVRINITITPNHPPIILPYNSTLSIDEDEELVINLNDWIEDEDEELTFTLNDSDPNLELNPMGFGSFQLVPADDVTGERNFSFLVEDEFNNTILLEAVVVIASVPDPPKFTSLNGAEVLVGTQDMSGYEDSQVVFNFTIEDPDLIYGGDSLTLTSDQMRIFINGTSGSFVPVQNDVGGPMVINFQVMDAYGLTDNVSIVLDVININDEPVLFVNGMVDTIEVSTDLHVNFSGSEDVDGDTLAYYVKEDGGNWIHAQFFHVLNFETTGNHTVVFKVDDGNGGIKQISYSILVVDAIDDDDDVTPPDDDITDDDDDGSPREAFSADPLMMVLVLVIAVLALIFITLLVMTLSSNRKRKDPWEDFDDDEWEE